MYGNKLEHIKISSLIAIGNYTGLHVFVALASDICYISLYYYAATRTSYLRVRLCRYTNATAVPKNNVLFQVYFFLN